MKRTFIEYYCPSESELKSLLQEAVIVFDTNVLLETYEVAKEGRELLLKVFRDLGGRAWIPYQVGLEFQRNRLRSIASERSRTSKAVENVGSSINSLIDQIEKLELAKRGIGVDSEDIIRSLKAARDRAVEALKKAHSAQPKLELEDDIRDQIDIIFDGRVGAPIESQLALDAVYREGAVRYANKTPPGYEDDGKDEVFSHGGLYYQKKFGDFVLWKQIISHAKDNSISKLIFVTQEKKQDWWLLRDRAIVGPQPALISEMRREGGVDDFWLLGLKDFVNLTNSLRTEKLSEIGIEQIEAADATRESGTTSSEVATIPSIFRYPARSFVDLRQAVAQWLSGQQGELELVDNIDLDLVVRDKHERFTGIEIHVVSSWRFRTSDNLMLKDHARELAESAAKYRLDAACLFVILMSDAGAMSMSARTPSDYVLDSIVMTAEAADIGVVIGAVSTLGFTVIGSFGCEFR